MGLHRSRAILARLVRGLSWTILRPGSAFLSVTYMRINRIFAFYINSHRAEIATGTGALAERRPPIAVMHRKSHIMPVNALNHA